MLSLNLCGFAIINICFIQSGMGLKLAAPWLFGTKRNLVVFRMRADEELRIEDQQLELTHFFNIAADVLLHETPLSTKYNVALILHSEKEDTNQSANSSGVHAFIKDSIMRYDQRLHDKLDKDLFIHTYTLDEILAYVPEVKHYLYETLQNGETGDCCGNSPVWQMCRVPVMRFLQLLDDQFKTYEHVWSIEPDVRVVGDMTFARWFDMIDKELPTTDVVAHETAYQEMPYNGWIQKRHTAEFAEILKRMDKAGVPWLALSDGLQRLSASLWKSHLQATRQKIWAFDETMLQPITWEYGATTHIFKAQNRTAPLPWPPNGNFDFQGIDRHSPQQKITEEEAKRIISEDPSATWGFFHLDHTVMRDPKNIQLGKHLTTLSNSGTYRG